MAWRLMKVNDLPFGKRVLSYGSEGKDVSALQRLLNQTGFYCGETDGLYGPLTEESVLLFQQAYTLKADGIAGFELFKILGNLAKNKRVGRIIYTIKERESLGAIAQRFSVNKDAWERLPGQSNPHKKTYLGMKILLHEKAFFVWEHPGEWPDGLEVTGCIKVARHFDSDGNLQSLANDSLDQDHYYLIGADAVTWVKLLHSHKSWRNAGRELQKLKGFKIGIDLREAPLEIMGIWIKFLKSITHDSKVKRVGCLLLPLTLKSQEFIAESFWANLPHFNDLAGLLFLQPIFDLESPDLFEVSAAKLSERLKRLVNEGYSSKSLLVLETEGWDWNLDSGEKKQVTYKKAQILRAMNSRTVKYSDTSKFTTIRYMSRGERHILVYRDLEGWRETLKMIIRRNLLGVAILNFMDLGKAGKELIVSSFAVMEQMKSEV